jgi:hypothetical protein
VGIYVDQTGHCWWARAGPIDFGEGQRLLLLVVPRTLNHLTQSIGFDCPGINPNPIPPHAPWRSAPTRPPG